MNLTKHTEFFDPLNEINQDIHIIGCGAIGSILAMMLTRTGIPELNLYDFDTITAHNIANQNFTSLNIGQPKTEALTAYLKAINPEIKLITYDKGYTQQPLSGYVFLCVDNIELRKEITTKQQHNPYIKAIFDFRMRLTDAQHYAADWDKPEQKEGFIQSMQFSSEEAKEATPVNACGSTLSINPTVYGIVALGVANFINFIKTTELKTMILHDPFHQITDAF